MAVPPTLDSILANFETGDIPTEAQFAEAWTASYNQQVPNVAALATLTPFDGEAVWIQGYYSVNDGGGQGVVYHEIGRQSGLWYFNGPGVDDYFEMVEKFTPFNVLRGGVHPTRTAAENDTALASIRADAIDLIWPDQSGSATTGSSYNFSAPVTFKYREQWHGGGSNTATRIRFSGFTGSAIVITDIEFWGIENLFLSNTDGVGSGMDGIEIDRGDYSIIRNVRVSGFDVGMLLKEVNTLRLEENYIRDNGVGIYIVGATYNNEVQINGGEVKGNTSHGIQIDKFATGIIINAVTIQDNGGVGVYVGPYVDNLAPAYHLIITDCWFELNAGGYNILLDNRLIGCRIEGNLFAQATDQIAWGLTAGTQKDVEVNNNFFYQYGGVVRQIVIGVQSRRANIGINSTTTDDHVRPDNSSVSTIEPLRLNFTDDIPFTATPAIDFDGGFGDTKTMTLTANVTSSTFASTRIGTYKLILTQSGGTWTFAVPAGIIGTAGTLEATGPTLWKFYYDGTNWFWDI